MARYKLQGIARDGAGNIIADASVSVYLAGTTTAASVYEAISGGTAVNSVETDDEGFYELYVDSIDYPLSQNFKITISKSGYTSKTFDEIDIFPGLPDYEIDVSSIYGNGSKNATILNTAITAVGTIDKMIFVLYPGVWTIDTDVTVPSNITLKIPSGALLTIATGKTLTINGPFEAGLYQVFDCVGTGGIRFGDGSISVLYLYWFGGVDGSSDNWLAWKNGLASIPNYCTVECCSGDYLLMGYTLITKNFITIKGNNANLIVTDVNAASWAYGGYAAIICESLNIRFQDMTLDLNWVVMTGVSTALSTMMSGLCIGSGGLTPSWITEYASLENMEFKHAWYNCVVWLNIKSFICNGLIFTDNFDPAGALVQAETCMYGGCMVAKGSAKFTNIRAVNTHMDSGVLCTGDTIWYVGDMDTGGRYSYENVYGQGFRSLFGPRGGEHTIKNVTQVGGEHTIHIGGGGSVMSKVTVHNYKATEISGDTSHGSSLWIYSGEANIYDYHVEMDNTLTGLAEYGVALGTPGGDDIHASFHDCYFYGMTNCYFYSMFSNVKSIHINRPILKTVLSHIIYLGGLDGPVYINGVPYKQVYYVPNTPSSVTYNARVLFGENNEYSAAPPVEMVYDARSIIRKTVPTATGVYAWVCTTAGGAYSTTRANTTAYTKGTWVKWDSGTTVWVCQTAGTTDGSAPSIVGKVVGDTVTDGTVVWYLMSLTAAVFSELKSF